MTHDDEDVTVPGDHEVIAELRRRGDPSVSDAPGEARWVRRRSEAEAASSGGDASNLIASRARESDESDDEITLAAEAEVIAEIRAAADAAAEPERIPLPPPRLGTLPPPEGPPVGSVPAAAEPHGGRWQPTGRLPVVQRVENRPTAGSRPGRARWFIGLAIVAAALLTAAIFSLRGDGDDGPAPATTEVVTTTSP